MQLLVVFVLGLLVQQNLAQVGNIQSGNLFSVGGTAPQHTGPVYANVGNVGTSQLNAVNSAAGIGAAGHLGAGPLGAGAFGGLGGLAGLAGKYGGAFPALGGLAGIGGIAGGLVNKLGLAGGLHPGLGAGLYGGGPFLPGGHGVGPVGVGVGVGAGPRKAPLKLTCQNSEYRPTGASSIAVTIMNAREQTGYGDLSGGFGLHGGLPGHGGSQGSLSFDLAIRIQGASGPAKVVFTKTAGISDGCSAESLGSVFTGDDRHDPFGSIFSHFGGGQGGGYGDEGVVTTLSIYPDQPTSVHKDRLSIENLEHLAGRGVAIVTGLTTDAYGEQTISGDVLACCALSYDDQPRALLTDTPRPIPIRNLREPSPRSLPPVVNPRLPPPPPALPPPGPQVYPPPPPPNQQSGAYPPPPGPHGQAYPPPPPPPNKGYPPPPPTSGRGSNSNINNPYDGPSYNYYDQ